MKTKITQLSLLLLLMVVNKLSSQTTATDFNVNDCAGTNHHLFADLDAGKVVVISFVMPCASCIGPSISAFNKVKSYASSDPGRVVFYLADDEANTNCASLTSWAKTNGITNVPVFSTTAVSMTNYGTAGMPKIIVLAGTSHSVLFNQNDVLTVDDLKTAIDKGLALTGIKEEATIKFNLKVYPNPAAANRVTLNYTLPESGNVTLGIYNALGALIETLAFQNQSSGQHESTINLEELKNGLYFFKLNTPYASDVIKCVVTYN